MQAEKDSVLAQEDLWKEIDRDFGRMLKIVLPHLPNPEHDHLKSFVEAGEEKLALETIAGSVIHYGLTISDELTYLIRKWAEFFGMLDDERYILPFLRKAGGATK